MLLFIYAATTKIYTLSLHDALPISGAAVRRRPPDPAGLGQGGALRVLQRDHCAAVARHLRPRAARGARLRRRLRDRKSTRLNSSHVSISYAVFCLKKKINPFACYWL